MPHWLPRVILNAFFGTPKTGVNAKLLALCNHVNDKCHQDRFGGVFITDRFARNGCCYKGFPQSVDVPWKVTFFPLSTSLPHLFRSPQLGARLALGIAGRVTMVHGSPRP